jgi:prepilin peptidase CpaA
MLSNAEFQAVIELLSMLILDWRNGTLFVLLIVAALIDFRTHKIPNWLVLAGTLFGIIYNLAYPPFVQAGILWPLEGMGLGFIIFLPLYLIGVMGAGDVKLMAMVGSIIGPVDMIWVLLYTMIVGGALSVLLVLLRGTAMRMFQNLLTIFRLGFMSTLSGHKPQFGIDTTASAGKLPYGVAIAIGTIGYLVFHQLGLL